MIDYHDTEWGVPVHDDRKHFEFLLLDAFQAGLSWAVILNKREGFRRALVEHATRAGQALEEMAHQLPGAERRPLRRTPGHGVGRQARDQAEEEIDLLLELLGERIDDRSRHRATVSFV